MIFLDLIESAGFLRACHIIAIAGPILLFFFVCVCVCCILIILKFGNHTVIFEIPC